jgi:hypothetical protein
MKPAVAGDPKKEPRLAAAAAGAESGYFDMPAMRLPTRTGQRMQVASSALTLILLAGLLGGCSGGDFGRTRADLRNDDMHGWVGVEATASVGLHPSQFQVTE